MNKWVLTLAAAFVLLAGCSEMSGSPSDNKTNPTTAPAPGETFKLPAFPAVPDPYDADQAAYTLRKKKWLNIKQV